MIAQIEIENLFSLHAKNILKNDSHKKVLMLMSASWDKKMLKEPNVLLAHNIPGSSGITMKGIAGRYDKRISGV